MSTSASNWRSVDVYRAGEESPVGEADAHVGSLDGPEALLTAADKLIHR
jgi:hypothetical protein